MEGDYVHPPHAAIQDLPTIATPHEAVHNLPPIAPPDVAPLSLPDALRTYVQDPPDEEIQMRWCAGMIVRLREGRKGLLSKVNADGTAIMKFPGEENLLTHTRGINTVFRGRPTRVMVLCGKYLGYEGIVVEEVDVNTADVMIIIPPVQNLVTEIAKIHMTMYRPTVTTEEELCHLPLLFKCPNFVSRCSIKKSIPRLLSHMANDHGLVIYDRKEFTIRYDIDILNPVSLKYAVWPYKIYHCFDAHFCLHFERRNVGGVLFYFAFLRFMGNKTEAANYGYSLKVSGNKREDTWEGIPRSIQMKHKDVWHSGDGLSIPHDKIIIFWEGDGNLELRLHGKIWQANNSIS